MVRICAAMILFVMTTSLGIYFRPGAGPDSWNHIHVGMTRESAEKALGINPQRQFGCGWGRHHYSDWEIPSIPRYAVPALTIKYSRMDGPENDIVDFVQVNSENSFRYYLTRTSDLVSKLIPVRLTNR
jgi:hypothetical protein